VAIIRRMARDLNFAVEIVACPTVREADGLAMSSRNGYLDAQERTQALALHRALMRVKKMWDSGEKDAAKLVATGREEIAGEKSVRLDYFEIVDGENLDAVKTAGDGAVVAVAAFVGATRLIDNVVLSGNALG